MVFTLVLVNKHHVLSILIFYYLRLCLAKLVRHFLLFHTMVLSEPVTQSLLHATCVFIIVNLRLSWQNKEDLLSVPNCRGHPNLLPNILRFSKNESCHG